MSEQNWLIVRVLSGHPFRVEKAIQDIGIAAYCPRFKIRRRNRWDRRFSIELTKVLFPGYLFAAKAFDVSQINRAPIKTRLMCQIDSRGDEQFLKVTPLEIERIRETEIEATKQGLARIEGTAKSAPDRWRIEKLVKAMEAVGAKPGQAINLGDLQRKVAS